MRFVFVSIFVAIFAAIPSTLAHAAVCPAPPSIPVCSYNAVNGDCKVIINRMNPVTPPTIYVKRGCAVTVTVVESSPFEDLTLDWKASATVIPPDTFQNAFSAVSVTGGKFTDVIRITQEGHGKFAAIPDRSKCESDPTDCDNAPNITSGQMREQALLRAFDPFAVTGDALKSIKIALQSPPGGPADFAQPWRDTVTWRTTVSTKLNAPIVLAALYAANIKMLASEIADFKKNNTDASHVTQAVILDQNQESLQKTLDTVTSTIAKFAVLKDAIDAIPSTGADIAGNARIQDTVPTEKNYQTQTWMVDFTNKLLPAAKRVAADTLKAENAALLSGIADAPAKQLLVTITVQFQSPSRFEVSSGLMVPTIPYHSYAKASVATNGVASDNVVQETKTYAVIPMAFINTLVKEWIVKQQRSAFFGTGGIGYNPATSAVEFGAGLTLSYRSIEFSALADIGRDTKLGGGFTVGQSLGNTNAAATPITSTYWTIKPAFALSVRIPLGGGGGATK